MPRAYLLCYTIYMIILAIETSCDETAIAIVKSNKAGTKCQVLSHTVLSQIDLHREYGGVFPMMAKREHARVIVPLLERCLREAELYKEAKQPTVISTAKKEKILKLLAREESTGPELLSLVGRAQIPKIDAISVTSGPGLEPALWVGINTALALGLLWNLPVYPINHMEGHILSAILQTDATDEKLLYSFPKVAFPALALLISGGHTELVRIEKFGKYKILGQTRDDAVGEAFDKVARMLGLPYPGGPEISRLAAVARDQGIQIAKTEQLPRPMLQTPDYDFSFSGLKTAVLYRIQKLPKLTDTIKELIALDFEQAVAEILVKKVLRAVEKTEAKTVIVGGGVSANTHIRSELTRALTAKAKLYIPRPSLSTDNALMIAVTAMTHITNGKKPKKKILADGGWHL
jgi:N6-L-threonylcarbamoyladenine synthase